jgi:hypothetical protein
VSASRLQQLSRILEVPVAHFFEGSPGQKKEKGNASWSAYVSDFVASTDGLALMKAFLQIKKSRVRHQIVMLVDEIVSD